MRNISLVTAISLLLAACGDPGPSSDELDASTRSVASCELREMIAAMDGIPTVSGIDATQICHAMMTVFGQPPETRALRGVAKAASMISIGEVGATNIDVVTVGKTLIEIAAARGQTDPWAIYNTTDLVLRLYSDTSGEVTPAYVLDFLRSSGPMAQTLSDDGLVNTISAMRATDG